MAGSWNSEFCLWNWSWNSQITTLGSSNLASSFRKKWFGRCTSHFWSITWQILKVGSWSIYFITRSCGMGWKLNALDLILKVKKVKLCSSVPRQYLNNTEVRVSHLASFVNKTRVGRVRNGWSELILLKVTEIKYSCHFWQWSINIFGNHQSLGHETWRYTSLPQAVEWVERWVAWNNFQQTWSLVSKPRNRSTYRDRWRWLVFLGHKGRHCAWC